MTNIENQEKLESPNHKTHDGAFVHLRNTSAYSLLRGAIPVANLVEQAGKFQMPALALTDRDNMFGCMEFSSTALKAGIQPIVGFDATINFDDSGAPKGGIYSGKMSGSGLLPTQRLSFLAQSEQGYHNLIRWLSEAYLNTDQHNDPVIELEQLRENEGVICLSDYCEGPLGHAFLNDQDDLAHVRCQKLHDLFKDRFYIEIQRHGLEQEAKIEERMLDLAYEYDIAIVATNNNHFLTPDMVEAHSALACIREGKYLDDENNFRLTKNHHFRLPEQMIEAFRDLPEAIANTLVIAQRTAFIPPERNPILPPYTDQDAPLNDAGTAGQSSEDLLRGIAKAGLENRLEFIKEQRFKDTPADDPELMALHQEYYDRLDTELDVIIRMGFSGYFLIVSDFIRWTKSQNIPVGPGRGSGAGSLVAWALTITDLDPIYFGLLFERFLNPERVSMPDFDIDFCQERRDEVIKYIQTKYGSDNVAQIITFGKLQARAVLRDVGRVLQMPYGQVDRICKMLPNNPADPMSLDQSLKRVEVIRNEYENDQSVRRLIDLARKLEGLYRHASTHAAGVVIGDQELWHLVPLYRDPRSSLSVTQFNMKWVEKAGLVKFDILGLKTLSVIAEAIEHLQRDEGEAALDILSIPLDDKETLDLYCSGQTAGVFQVESAGMRDALRELQPDRFGDIIALVALYRPGPMDNIPTYNARKKGQKFEYLHPKLEIVLAETYGIPVYQEQVMQMAQVLAGYTLGGADLLRRAMGKKIKEEMEAQRNLFIEGTKKVSGIDAPLADKIFNQINAFAGYGFNKSHAAAYALVSYQTAYLKAHYPLEFWSATLSFDMDHSDKMAQLIEALKSEEVNIIPPDINLSSHRFKPCDDPNKFAIHYALGAIKNVGEQAMLSVVQEREENGDYSDVFDFIERIDIRTLNRRQLENLVKAGAFDRLHPNRSQLYHSLDTLLRYGQTLKSDRESSQVNLFGSVMNEDQRPALSDQAEWSLAEKIDFEKDGLGFYLSSHPLEVFKATLEKLKIMPISDVKIGKLGQKKGLIAGIPTTLRRIRTKNDKPMGFLTLTDQSGSIDVSLFDELLTRYHDLITSDYPLVADIISAGRDRDDNVRVRLLGLSRLDDKSSNISEGYQITFNDESAVRSLSDFFEANIHRGNAEISFMVTDCAQGSVEVILQEKYHITPPIRRAIKSLPGVIEISPY